MALKTTSQDGGAISTKFWEDLIADMRTLEQMLGAVLNGAVAQIAAAAGKVPVADSSGKIGDDWLRLPVRGMVNATGALATTLTTATEAPVTLDTPRIDTITGSLQSNTITVPPNASMAMVTGKVGMLASTATAGRIYAGITLDGVLDATTVDETEKSGTGSGAPSVHPQGMLPVVAGQIIGMNAYQDSGADWDTQDATLSVVFY